MQAFNNLSFIEWYWIIWLKFLHFLDNGDSLNHNAENKLWIIGQHVHIGSAVGHFFSQGTVPYEATGWYYLNNGHWNFTTTAVVVELGK